MGKSITETRIDLSNAANRLSALRHAIGAGRVDRGGIIDRLREIEAVLESADGRLWFAETDMTSQGEKLENGRSTGRPRVRPLILGQPEPSYRGNFLDCSAKGRNHLVE